MEGGRGRTIIQLLMERRIWSGIIKTNGGGGGVRGGCACVCVFTCACSHVCKRGRKSERPQEAKE